MSVDRVDLTTQKGSVSNVSGSAVSVTNLNEIEASLANIDASAEASANALAGAASDIPTADFDIKQISQEILTQLKILTLYAGEITGEVITEEDIT